MSRWKNTDDFISWVRYKKDEADKVAQTYFKEQGRNFQEQDFKDCASKGSMAVKNASLNIEIFEKIIDDSILQHLNYYDNLEIDIFHLAIFFETADSVNFFKKSGLSTDANDFEDEIKSLKKRADNLQLYSSEQIEIRLPLLPQISLYVMVSRLKRYGVSKEIINSLYSYFPKRQRLPKRTKSYLERMEAYDAEVDRYYDPAYPLSLEDAMNTARHELNYYKPTLTLS